MGQSKVLTREGGLQLRRPAVGSRGLGDAVGNSNRWQPAADPMQDRKLEGNLTAEPRGSRSRAPDNRAQCLCFIAPSGPGFKPSDSEFVKRLHEKMNIIPFIAKADTLTLEECQQFKTHR